MSPGVVFLLFGALTLLGSWFARAAARRSVVLALAVWAVLAAMVVTLFYVLRVDPDSYFAAFLAVLLGVSVHLVLIAKARRREQSSASP